MGGYEQNHMSLHIANPPRDSSAVREHSNHMSLHTAKSENGMNNTGMNVDHVMKRNPWLKENNLGIGVVSLNEVTIFVSLLVPTAPLFVRFGLFSLVASSKAHHGPRDALSMRAPTKINRTERTKER